MGIIVRYSGYEDESITKEFNISSVSVSEARHDGTRPTKAVIYAEKGAPCKVSLLLVREAIQYRVKYSLLPGGEIVFEDKYLEDKVYGRSSDK